MSLRFRIAAVVAAVVAVVVVAVGVTVHRSTERALIDEIDDDLVGRVRPPADDGERAPRFALERFRDLTQRDAFRAGARTDPFGAVVGFDALARVIDAEGNVRGELAGEFDAPTDPDLIAAAQDGPVLTDGMVGGERARVVSFALPGGAVVQLARPLDEVEAVLDSLRDRTIVVGAVAIAAAALAAWVIATATARPIRRLTDAAEYVAETGDLSRPVDGAGASDEVGRLATSFTTMLDALAHSRRQQHRLVMDASHELRTPLTSLRTNVDVLRRGHSLEKLSEADRDALLDDVDLELTELSDLVSELVELATDVESEEAVVPLTLAELAEPVAERARRRTGRTIEIDVGRSVVLEGRAEALSRAIRNLVDNAAKFSPDATTIRIEIDGGSLTVHDAGPGIPESEHTLVFERFHRVEATRTMPGSGLGLAIVRHVVEAHGGSVAAGRSPDGGAAVGFTLPTV